MRWSRYPQWIRTWVMELRHHPEWSCSPMEVLSVQYLSWKVTCNSSGFCRVFSRFRGLVLSFVIAPRTWTQITIYSTSSFFICQCRLTADIAILKVSCLQGLPRQICSVWCGVRVVCGSNFLDSAHHDANQACKDQQGSMQSRYISNELIHIIYPWSMALPRLKEIILQ